MRAGTLTISIKADAYKALSRLKKEGQSFSDVILENLRPRPRTCGELLDELERDFAGVRLTDPNLMSRVKRERGRRSNRPTRR